MTEAIVQQTRRKGGIPRGLSATGPVLFSYGFRPFFLGGALCACLAMILWIMAMMGFIGIGGDYGASAWHGHEMLFGFGSAIVTGFLLTAVPNWTGRLPVSGPPLLVLFLLWFAGRLALVSTDLIGLLPAALVEAAFLPTILVVCVREIVAGRKWADLKVIAGLGALTVANICYHYETLAGSGPDYSQRLAIAAYTMMIVIVGGRILPSFTRNWLNKSGRTDFPVPYNGFDLTVILLSVPAFALWIVLPESSLTAGVTASAALLQGVRLWRWRGWTTWREPLVVVLHLSYALVPAGFAAISAAALGLMESTAVLHVLTVGTITSMMLAVMTRATRGHTGRELTASVTTCISYAAIFACALARPSTAFMPDHAPAIYAVAGILWLAAFGLYLIEYGPMLVARRKPSARTQ
ncbi:NnrS family protein [Rhizobium sp. KVB221]|uniref:NnrS family protein n=1 Tax=Rhizobium setariae TaxID=2801340 RepID=A0A936YVD7_9HYPH|nr:NnrS family protein [Rhizobium setariae]MBL0373575.1 NnrS family protein [Rhizobium setariae]